MFISGPMPIVVAILSTQININKKNNTIFPPFYPQIGEDAFILLFRE